MPKLSENHEGKKDYTCTSHKTYDESMSAQKMTAHKVNMNHEEHKSQIFNRTLKSTASVDPAQQMTAHGDIILPEWVREHRNDNVPAQKMTAQNEFTATELVSMQQSNSLPESLGFLLSGDNVVPQDLCKEQGFDTKETFSTEIKTNVICPVYKNYAVGNTENINKNQYSEVIGDWTNHEQSLSSTWRETEAVNKVIQSNSNNLKNSFVKIYSDNKNVKYILLNGSRVSNIHESAIELNTLCEQEGIILCPEWIPREKNEKADHLSRCYDCDDWSIAHHIFQFLEKQWGQHTIDRFATHFNNKCVRFNSRWWVPGTIGVDAFSQPWQHEVNWLVPPPALISDCLDKIVSEKAVGTMIVPQWKSAPFWPKLFESNDIAKYFIKAMINLGNANVIVKGKGNNGIFMKNPLPFDMLALKISS